MPLDDLSPHFPVSNTGRGLSSVLPSSKHHA
jgi:hypothetical protein